MDCSYIGIIKHSMGGEVRNLDAIQEHQDGEHAQARRFALYGILVLTLVMLVLAMSSWVSRIFAAEQKPVNSQDGLEAFGITVNDDDSNVADRKGKAETSLRKEDLHFPSELASADVRPEVEAAVAAAAAEYMHPDGAETTSANIIADRPMEQIENELQEMKAQALAPAGHEGPFVLQVMSYDNPKEAYSYARLLRARGHQAYVMAADVEERGPVWRVRIGPFKGKVVAENYLRGFESKEQLSGHVVRGSAP